MSILERMRGSTDSTPMQIVLVLIVVAFIGWFSLPQAETVQVAVEVNGERVLAQEFGLRLGEAIRMEQMATGRRPDDTREAQIRAEVKDKIDLEELAKQVVAGAAGLARQDALKRLDLDALAATIAAEARGKAADEAREQLQEIVAGEVSRRRAPRLSFTVEPT